MALVLVCVRFNLFSAITCSCFLDILFSVCYRLLQEFGGMDERKEYIFTDFWVLERLKRRFDDFIMVFFSLWCFCSKVSNSYPNGVGIPASNVPKEVIYWSCIASLLNQCHFVLDFVKACFGFFVLGLAFVWGSRLRNEVVARHRWAPQSSQRFWKVEALWETAEALSNVVALAWKVRAPDRYKLCFVPPLPVNDLVFVWMIALQVLLENIRV